MSGQALSGIVLLLLLPLGCGLTTEDIGTVSDAGSATGGEGGTDGGDQGGADPEGGDASDSNGAAGGSAAEGGAAGAGQAPVPGGDCTSSGVQAYIGRDFTQRVGYVTVRSALAAAAAGDTVTVCPGTHDLSLDGGTLVVSRPVTLVGLTAVIESVLDVGGTGDVVRVAPGVGEVFIVDVTLTGSTDARGLAVEAGASATVRHSVIAENGGGGVVVRDGATVELDATGVSSNTAAEGGAGIRADNGTVRLADSTVVGNRATESGGGISCFGYGSLTIEASRIWENATSRSGGGIVNNCSLSITDFSEISGNTARSNGGGLADSGIDGVIRDTTIIENHADYDGGGISCLESNGLELTRATVSGNTAGQRGGGAYISGGTLRSTDTDWGTAELDDNSPTDVSFLDSDYEYSGMASFECEEATGCISL